MAELVLTANHRILGLFPHPDDESLGAGVLLQRAAAAGASVLPVFLTSGEGNSWPQRVLDRKLWLDDQDRRRFAARRETEAKTALRILGLDPQSALFLGLPDTALTSLLVREGPALLQRLAALVADFRPHWVLAPVLADCHPDHSATAILAVALQRQFAFRLLAYATHAVIHPTAPEVELSCTETELAIKERAIAAHRTQLVFRRRFHLRFARAPEVYLPIHAPPATPQVRARWKGDRLDLSFRLPMGLRSLRPPVLTVVTLGEKLSAVSLRTSPRSLKALPAGRGGVAHVHREGRRRLILRLAQEPELVFVKLSRPLFLYDEVGFVQAETSLT